MSARAAPARRRSSAPRWVFLPDAEQYSGIPRRTLRRWVSEGRLPAERFGPRRIRVDLNDLDALAVPIPAAPPPSPAAGEDEPGALRETG